MKQRQLERQAEKQAAKAAGERSKKSRAFGTMLNDMLADAKYALSSCKGALEAFSSDEDKVNYKTDIGMVQVLSLIHI